MNKKGIAFEWLYALIFLFALGISFIIFDNVLQDSVYPLVNNLIPDSFSGKEDIITMNNEWMSYWLLMPIIIFFTVIIYILVQGIGSRNENY